MKKFDGKPAVFERLNQYCGYFYTVKKRLYKGKTKFQKIELVDTEQFGRTLLLDGITQVGERTEFLYHEPMVHPALCSHPKPQNVLVVGAGDGGILREVLKYPTVERVELAELDGDVVEFSKKYLADMNGGSLTDPRVEVCIVDGRKHVEQNRGKYDVVIMDMTDPFGPSKMLYTKEFFKAVKRSLRGPEGLFVMHTESPITRPVAVDCIRRTLGSVFTNVRSVYLYIEMYATLWSIAVSSDSTDIARCKSGVIDRRLKKYGIEGLKVYTGATHEKMQVAFPFVDQLIDNAKGRIITDAKPDFPDHFVAEV